MLDSIYMQVLDMSKTASIAILVVILARLLLKKAPKVFSYALWAVVLFRLLCPVTFEAPVSIVPEMSSVSQGYTLSEESISVFGAGEAAYQAVGDALNGGLGIQHIRTTEKTETGMTKYVTTDWWSVWILFGQYVWVAGIAAMLTYSAVSYLRIRKKLSVIVPLRENIFIADDIKSPFVVGLFHPKIYLPCNLGEKEQEYIILHEQHHIKRLDHIMKALAFLALAIHWFNPLVWVAFILASKDMEMSCDEAVIRKVGGDVRADYSASLLTLATGRRIIAGTPLAFGEGDTKGRINNLSKWKKPAIWVVLLAVVACVVLAVCLLTNPNKHETMDWAQNLSDDDIASADLVVYPQTEDKQFKQLSEAELTDMVALINQSKGKYQAEYEQLSGGSVFFYITMKDGTSHSIGNIGNTYLVIDGDYYEADYNWLVTWYTLFGEGNSSIPDQYFSVQLTLDNVVELSQKGSALIWADFGKFKYYETGSGLYIRVYEIDEVFSLWIGGSGPENELEPMYIYLALNDDIDTHIDIRDGNVEEFIEQYNSKSAGNSTEPILWDGELIPGTTYVSYQCLYMNPLSSYAAMGGDSGCKYIVGEDYFATISRNDGSFVSVTHPDLDTANSGLDGLQNMIDVSKWEWQEFPYTDEEWAALYAPQGFGGISNISELYDEMLYQPLAPGKFLLKMDSSLWLVELASNEQMGTYLWSIYSLVPETAMGVAQWEYAPMLSSRCPLFRFEFDMDYTEISAVCTESLLMDWETPGATADHSMTFKKGVPLCWSPIDEDGNVVTAAIIYFTVQQGETTPYAGTIYIEGNSGYDGRRIYNATIVGTGLHLDPNTEMEGGVISAIASPNVIRVVEHDLTTGDLEVPVEDLVSYVFYTNSEQISVTVKGGDFDGQVNLLDVSQNNAHILQAKVNTREDDCLFTGLTSARLYRVDCEGLDGCTVVISGDN